MTREKEKQKCKINIGSVLGAAVRSPRFWLIMLFPAALLLIAAARNIPGFADLYANTVYRAVSLFWNNLSGILPFSLAEFIVIIAPFALLAYIIVSAVITVRAKGRRLKALLKSFVSLLAAVSLVFFLYVTNCGLNYYCTRFSAQSGLAVKKVTAQQLYRVCEYYADMAASSRAEISRDDGSPLAADVSSLRFAARDAVNALHERFPSVAGGYSVPKSVILSRGMSYLDITGVYFPFTFEANVNTDAGDYCLPFTMCHELAHVRGFMNEADANFIAFLACVRSDDPWLRYSGSMNALRLLQGHLYTADESLYKQLLSHYSAGMFTDLKAQSEYWKQFETPVAAAASSINDSYLKINRQQEGVKSYGLAADLIIACYFDEHETDG